MSGRVEELSELPHNDAPGREPNMAGTRESIHGLWSSRWAFILAATGSAVGLGNIWRFPYMAGENGGGAFVLVYLAFVAAIGVPLMMAEVMVGRRGRRSPINTMRALARDEGLSPNWQYLGWAGVLAGFLILSFYSVVAGWSLAYIVHVGAGNFTGATAKIATAEFDSLTASPYRLLLWHSIFMVMTVLVVSRGVRAGLERAVTWLMPALFVMLIVMVFYAIGNGDFRGGARYLFAPDFTALTPATVLAALGQAFFSLSLGMGAIMVYGSYLPSGASIPRTTFTIAICDTAVAILAGLAIFPIVFAYGLEPQGGAGLVFKTLTIAFGHMPWGQFFGALFFTLLTVAAWTSAISLLEPIVAWLIEDLHMGRLRASIAAGFVAWIFGIGSLLSFNVWADVKFFGRTFFDLMQFLSADLMLPIGGLFIAVFAGWQISYASRVDELGIGDGIAFAIWQVLLKFVAPIAVLLIILNLLGVFGGDS